MTSQDPVSRSWPELVVGALMGIFAAGRFGVDGGAAVLIALGGAFVAYLIGCALFPLRRCWLCKGRAFITDGRGGMRERPCLRCGRRRIIRKPGARLIGAMGRRE